MTTIKTNIYELKTTFKKVATICEPSFTNPDGVVKYLKNAFNDYLQQEQFWIILLNGNNVPFARHRITIGLVNQTQVHACEVFRMAISNGAVSIILAHNHPSGSLNPSSQDVTTTSKLCEVGKLLDIPVLDHIISGEYGYTSMKSSHPHLFA